MKTGVIICLSVSTLWAILAIMQLWFSLIPADIFMKITITAGVIVTVALVITLAIREYISGKDLKSKNYID